jgi:hypothetical protein
VPSVVVIVPMDAPYSMVRRAVDVGDRAGGMRACGGNPLRDGSAGPEV